MFRKGGSADSVGTGITSGLAPRQGYKDPGTVQQDDLSKVDIRNMNMQQLKDLSERMAYKAPPMQSDRSLNNFLIDFGLDIASRPSAGPGFGGLLTTAAQSAKYPFAQFQQARAGQAAFDDKLALGAYDVVKGEQAAEKDFEQKKDLIRLESELNPKLKKVFREEIPEVRINEYADSLLENDFDFIKNNSREIASDIVTYNVFKEKNPDSGPATKDFRGILPYEYDKKGKPVPNYETITVGQVFYNPEDGLFYERIAEEGIVGTDFKALDPFTYD
jgi:hypothetical protein